MTYTLCLNCCQLIIEDELERHNTVCRMNHIQRHIDSAMNNVENGINSINKIFDRNLKACIPVKGIRLRKRLGENEEQCPNCTLIVKLPLFDDTIVLCCDGIHMTQRDMDERKLFWRDIDGQGVQSRMNEIFKRFGLPWTERK